MLRKVKWKNGTGCTSTPETRLHVGACSRGVGFKIEIPTCGNKVQVKRIRPRFFAFASKRWKVIPQFNLCDTTNKDIEIENLTQKFFVVFVFTIKGKLE